MATTQLNTNINDEPQKAGAELGVVIQHFAALGLTFQSANASGQGVVTITYTGSFPAAQKAHLNLT